LFWGNCFPQVFCTEFFFEFRAFFGLYFAWVSYAEMDKSIFCPQEEKRLGDMPGIKNFFEFFLWY